MTESYQFSWAKSSVGGPVYDMFRVLSNGNGYYEGTLVRLSDAAGTPILQMDPFRENEGAMSSDLYRLHLSWHTFNVVFRGSMASAQLLMEQALIQKLRGTPSWDRMTQDGGA